MEKRRFVTFSAAVSAKIPNASHAEIDEFYKAGYEVADAVKGIRAQRKRTRMSASALRQYERERIAYENLDWDYSMNG